MSEDQNEPYSRIKINDALRDSGWDLLNPLQVNYEQRGASGLSDYLLRGENGPICILEAKPESQDPYDAKEQARGYAENVNSPFIILSNGNEHWFWNYKRTDSPVRFWVSPPPKTLNIQQIIKSFSKNCLNQL